MHGEHGLAMTAREVEQRAPQLEAGGHQSEDELPLPHPVHRHVDVVRGFARCAGVPPTSSPHACDDEPLDVKEQILAGAVVGDAADVGLGDANRVRRAARCASAGETMSLSRQHDEMGVVNRHQRREEQLLRVFEVLD